MQTTAAPRVVVGVTENTHLSSLGIPRFASRPLRRVETGGFTRFSLCICHRGRSAHSTTSAATMSKNYAHCCCCPAPLCSVSLNPCHTRALSFTHTRSFRPVCALLVPLLLRRSTLRDPFEYDMFACISSTEWKTERSLHILARYIMKLSDSVE